MRSGLAADRTSEKPPAVEWCRAAALSATDLPVDTPARRSFLRNYTIDGLKAVDIEGMPSVHGRSGQVWYHISVVHSRYVERYQVKLAARLGCPHVGTVVRGGCEGVRTVPKMYRKVFERFQQLGQTFGETGQFDEALVRKLAGPERFGAPMRLLFQLMWKTKAGTSLWDDQLKANGAYEERFARPYVE